ncbi:MAG: T9SS type A sorting domain-containing protein [Bacteroidota bacterium]
MKKLLLFSFSLLMLSVIAARPVPSQNLLTGSTHITATDTLELYDIQGNKINNATIKVTGTNPTVDALVGHIWIKNTTNTRMPNVFVRRTINHQVDSTANAFCFGINCYSPMTDESVYADTLPAGVRDTSFYADYYPDPFGTGGHGGLTSITYEFFDAITFGHRVSAKATIEFHISGAGINEDKMVFKGPYPNPASLRANLDYNLPTSSNNAQLIIRNTLGVVVETVNLEGRSGKNTIDVSGYASGIYFYSISVDGKVVQTKKLIVKH